MNLFYPYRILVNRSNGSCNNVNDLYAKIRVPDVFKGIGTKLFNLISRTNAARHIGCYETCMYKCRLNTSVCNNEKCWIKIIADVNLMN